MSDREIALLGCRNPGSLVSGLNAAAEYVTRQYHWSLPHLESHQRRRSQIHWLSVPQITPWTLTGGQVGPHFQLAKAY